MKLKELTLCALGIALVFLSTFFIKIPAAHGYFNLGDAVIFIFASYLSPIASFMLGGIGSCIADLSGGYVQYAVFTLIIKGLEAMLVAYLLKHKQPTLMTFAIGGLWMVVGYFV
ncbi:MAG: ECF transporter S component, partial [Niameybacter sp.]